MQKMQAVVFGTFPELERLMTLKFYTEDELLRRSLGHLVIDKRQILQRDDKADYMVAFHECNSEKGHKRQILINREDVATADVESLEWNIADEIFDAIF